MQEEGDYKICFDNKFSYLSSKVVYFEILNVNEDEDYDDLAGLWDENGDYVGEYDVEVSDIEVHKYKVLWCRFGAWNLCAWVSYCCSNAKPLDLNVYVLQAQLKKIKDDIVKARHLQDQIRVTDLKDRGIAEHNFERVNFMSTFYVIILVISGLAQVVMVRSLFDEKSKINPLWKKAFKD